MGTPEYKAIALSAMSTVLRPVGFRKRGSVYTRTLEDVLHLVSLQSSSASSASEVRLAVNLAVWVPALSHGGAPEVWSAHWRERLGTNGSAGSDQWWRVSNDSEAVAVANKISAAISQFGLPALESLRSAAALVRLWDSGVSPGLTKIQAERFLHELGQSPKAG